MAREITIKRIVSFFSILFLSSLVGIGASASEFNFNCTNSSKSFSTNYKVNMTDKTIIHTTSMNLDSNKKYNVYKEERIILFKDSMAVTMSINEVDVINFSVFNFEKETYSQSGHYTTGKPHSQFFHCVKSD